MQVISRAGRQRWKISERQRIILNQSVWQLDKGEIGTLVAYDDYDGFFAAMDNGMGLTRGELLEPWSTMKLLFVYKESFDFIKNECVMR